MQQRLEKKFDIGITNAISFAASPVIGQALQQQDREAAIRELAAVSKRYETESNYKGIRLHLFDAAGKTFARSWKPEAHGDSPGAIAPLLAEVRQSGKSGSAIVADDDGVFIRGTALLRHGDAVAGYVQFLQGVGSISRDFEAEGKFFIQLIDLQAAGNAPSLQKNRQVGRFRLANDAWFSPATVAAFEKVDFDALCKDRMGLVGDLFLVCEPIKDVHGTIIGLHAVAEPASILKTRLDAAMGGAITSMLLMILGFLAIGVVLHQTIRHAVLRPLQAITQFTNEVAGGSRTTSLLGRFRFELLVLRDALVAMVDSLKASEAAALEKEHEAEAHAEQAEQSLAEASARGQELAALMQAIVQSVDGVRGNAAQVLDAVHHLSNAVDGAQQGAGQQQARTTETATAMEEMHASIQEVARSAANASSSAADTSLKAADAAAGVHRTIKNMKAMEEKVSALKESMQSLGTQAGQIGTVLAVIGDIADQTNLLALNAAIEAARAGDAGRGFAVVADEVRKLAEKTMTATREVETSVRSIQNAAAHNVQSVEQAAAFIANSASESLEAGNAMQAIVDLAKGSSQQVDMIATAAEEQRATSEEINRSVTHVSEVATEVVVQMDRSAQSLTRIVSLMEDLSATVTQLSASADGSARLSSDGSRRNLFEWTPTLSTGIHSLDGEHKVLIGLINELHDAMRDNKDRHILGDTLDRLKDYAVHHFANEEGLFQTHAYPDTQAHLVQHQKFLEKVMQFHKDFQAGRATVTLDLMRFLKEWLQGHIQQVDKRYGPFLAGKGVR